MAGRRSDLATRSDGPRLERIGRLALRSGRFVTVTAAPIAVLAGFAVILAAPSLSAGVDAAVATATGPLGPPDGVGWLFHAGVLVVLTGAWLSGAGLVLTGLFD